MYIHCVLSRHWPSPLKRQNAGPDHSMLVADELANGEEPKESRLPAPHNRYRDGAPLPGFFWLFAIGELVSNTPCVILAASWWVSGEGQCRDETR